MPIESWNREQTDALIALCETDITDPHTFREEFTRRTGVERSFGGLMCRVRVLRQSGLIAPEAGGGDQIFEILRREVSREAKERKTAELPPVDAAAEPAATATTVPVAPDVILDVDQFQAAVESVGVRRLAAAAQAREYSIRGAVWLPIALAAHLASCSRSWVQMLATEGRIDRLTIQPFKQSNLTVQVYRKADVDALARGQIRPRPVQPVLNLNEPTSDDHVNGHGPTEMPAPPATVNGHANGHANGHVDGNVATNGHTNGTAAPPRDLRRVFGALTTLVEEGLITADEAMRRMQWSL